MKFEKNKEYVVVEGAKAKARQAKESCADGFVPQGKVPIAVFDVDRTCIDGRSPLRLTAHLAKTGKLRPDVIGRMLFWGAAYKLHLPQNESWVRQQVFRPFVGKPKEQVDQYLGDFYDSNIEKLFRPEMDALIRKHRDEGCFVIVVSATFEPMLLRMMQRHPVHDQISTRMKVDDQGNYTNEVDGLPVEGDQKVASFEAYANERFGEGNWEVRYAYSDHYSDRPLLALAEHPVCVNPDTSLSRTAKREGWDVMEL